MHAIGYIVVFLSYLSLAILAWPALLLWRLLGNARRKPAEPQCVRCGYPTAHLTAPRCPECGSDLLRDGILTPAMRVRSGGGVFLAIAAWTLTLTSLTLFLAAWIAFAIPYDSSIDEQLSGEPVSGNYQRVSIRGEGSFQESALSISHSQQFTRVLVVVTANDGGTHDLRLTREHPHARFQLESGELVDEFVGLRPDEVMRDLLVRAGAPSDDPVTQVEAAELVNVINGTAYWGASTASRTGPFVATVRSSISTSPDGTMYLIFLPVVVCFAGMGVWIVGVVILANQHMKKHRPVRHALGDSASSYGDDAEPEHTTASRPTSEPAM